MCCGNSVCKRSVFILLIFLFKIDFGYFCFRLLFMHRLCTCGEKYVLIYIIVTKIVRE